MPGVIPLFRWQRTMNPTPPIQWSGMRQAIRVATPSTVARSPHARGWSALLAVPNLGRSPRVLPSRAGMGRTPHSGPQRTVVNPIKQWRWHSAFLPTVASGPPAPPTGLRRGSGTCAGQRRRCASLRPVTFSSWPVLRRPFLHGQWNGLPQCSAAGVPVPLPAPLPVAGQRVRHCVGIGLGSVADRPASGHWP